MFLKISAIISAMFKRKLLKINKLARLSAKKRDFAISLYTYIYLYVYINKYIYHVWTFIHYCTIALIV